MVLRNDASIVRRLKTVLVFLIITLMIGQVKVIKGYAAADFQPPQGRALEKVLSDFETYALKAMKEWGVPGMSMAVVRGNELIYRKAFGVRELGRPDPVTLDTVFQVGSTTKAFTAALAAMMVDEGHLGWKDKVIDHLPEFRMFDPWVTSQFEVQDLMAQRSGLEPQVLGSMPLVGFDRQALKRAMGRVKPVSSFRSEYAYINVAFVWAAALVEKHTGKTWEDNLEERIFTPLGMSHSSATKEGYLREEDKVTLHARKDDDPDGEILVLFPDWPYYDWVYVMGPAGSIGSNILDMSRWLRMFINEGRHGDRTIIKPENLNYMLTPKTIAKAGLTGERLYYCLAWVFNSYRPHPIVWHNGTTFGAHSVISLMPEEKIGLVVLTNLRGHEVPEALMKKFYDLYFQNPERDWSAEMLAKAREAAVKVKNEHKRPENPLPPRPLEHYTGVFENEVYGRVELKAESGRLSVIIGPKPLVMPLEPYNGDVFWGIIPEFSSPPDFVRFQMDPDGRAGQVTLDAFNEGQAGIFHRLDKEK